MSSKMRCTPAGAGLGELSEIFYESCTRGEELPNEAWVRGWTAWASAYHVRQRRRRQYQAATQALLTQMQTIAEMIR